MTSHTQRSAAMARTEYGQLAGRRIVLVESPDNAAAFAALAAAAAHGARLSLLSRDPGKLSRSRKAVDDPLASFADVVVADTTTVDGIAEALARLPDCELCMTFSDYHCLPTARAAEWAGVPGLPVGTMEAATNKGRLRQALAGTEFAVPFVLASSPADLDQVGELGFPVVAKPLSEGASIGVRIVRDEHDLTEAYEHIATRRTAGPGIAVTGEVLFEAFLDGPEISVETMTTERNHQVYGVTAKTLHDAWPTTEVGHAFACHTDQEVVAVTRNVLDAVGMSRGPAHTELKLTTAGPRVVEVNPRVAGGHIPTLISRVCNVDPYLDALLACLGAELPIPVADDTACAIRAVTTSVSGTLTKVLGVDEAAASSGVFLVDVTARPGDQVGPALDNTGRLGWVGAFGSSRHGADALAFAAMSSIALKVKPDG